MAKHFDFQHAVSDLLARLGVEPLAGAPYDRKLQTRFGGMQLKVYDDWVACRFENIEAARLGLPPGRLNPHSGKWNWHFERPGFDDLLALARELADVRFDDDDIEEILPAAGWGDEGRNTALSYIYRDGANYKTDHKIVLGGDVSKADVKLIYACCMLEAHPYFIPGQIELPDLQDGFCGGMSRWNDEFDHPHHELHEISRTDGPATKGSPSSRAVVCAFLRVATGGGWDDAYEPPFVEAMRARGGPAAMQ